jgi:hypothetical protein
MSDKIKFSKDNYPKSYGSIKQDFYRLNKFLNLPKEELKKIEGEFWDFIYQKAKKSEPKKEYKEYEFLNSGWEWSVFIKNSQTLIKIPAGIFSEVNEQKYLDNTEFAYNKILDYFPQKYVAETKFKRENQLNIMEQEYISPQKETTSSVYINEQSVNKKLLNYTKSFLNHALEMLSDYHWLPDLDVKETEKGFHIRNIIYSSEGFIPKIIDFTAYYDVYRLYPQRTEYEVKEKAKKIKEAIEWMDNQNAN